MDRVKKLKLIIALAITIPLIIGFYLQTFENVIIQASVFHFYFVLASAFVSLILSVFAFMEYQRTKVSIVLMVAIGFLGVAIIYAFHGFITPLYSLFTFNTLRDQLNLFVLYGDLSRFWLAIFVFSSGLYIHKFVNKVGLIKFIIGLTLFIFAFTILVIYTPELIPNVKRADGTDTQLIILIKVVTLVLFGTTINKYYSSYKIKPNVSVMFLIIGLVFISGAVIIFMISTPWGLVWWMAHILYLLTYLTIGYGIYYNYYKNQKLEYFDVLDEVKTYINKVDETNLQLEALTNTDMLTNISNRKCFMVVLNELIDINKLNKEKFSVFFIDVDNFKFINDNYGHTTGDEVLKSTANRIKSLIEPSDLPARFAGDEFVILVNKATKQKLVKLAKKLNKKLSEPILADEKEINIHVSIGIAIYPDDGTSAEELIQKSDQAMYEVKKKGKNDFDFFDSL